LKAIRHAHELPVPQGAFALGESFENLKERMRLLADFGGRTRMVALAVLVASVLVLFVAMPSRASVVLPKDSIEANSAADRATFEWLKLLDEGKSDESWNLLSVGFKKVFSLEQWRRLTAPRADWGKCQSRRLAASEFSAKEDQSSGVPVLHEWVSVRYDSLHEKIGHHWDTITVVKGEDGQWRIDAYVITPR
jgi:uncharacterized protein DUF4019